jgi:hypothetical protein
VKALAIAMLIACAAPHEPVQDGHSPEVSDCCWLLYNGTDAVVACVRDMTDVGQCRWLTCLGGLVEFEVCRDGR